MSTMNINQFWLKQSNLFSWNKKPSIAVKKKKITNIDNKNNKFDNTNKKL